MPRSITDNTESTGFRRWTTFSLAVTPWTAKITLTVKKELPMCNHIGTRDSFYPLQTRPATDSIRRSPPTLRLTLAICVSLVYVVIGAEAATTALHIRGYPPCGGAPGISKDPDGDKTFVHVKDSAGNDFEVRCHAGIASYNYEFWVSFPNGTRSKVDTCELEGGLNDIVLHITGTTTTSTGTNGGQVINVTGLISKYYHHNLNSSRDFHTIYDYATKTATRFDTKRDRQPGGGYWDRYDRFLEVSSFVPPVVTAAMREDPSRTARGKPSPENATAQQSSSVQQSAKGPAGTADPAPCACESGDVEEGLTIAETEVRGTPLNTAVIYHLKSTVFSAVRWDPRRRALRIELPAGHKMPAVSLAIPRRLFGDTTKLSRVAIDGRTVRGIECITDTFHTLTFPLPPGAKAIAISQ